MVGFWSNSFKSCSEAYFLSTTRRNMYSLTGAGDTFCGCSINGVLKYGLDNLDEEKLKEILTYANAGAALITMKKGAIRSMPEPQNIKELIGE